MWHATGCIISELGATAPLRRREEDRARTEGTPRATHARLVHGACQHGARVETVAIGLSSQVPIDELKSNWRVVRRSRPQLHAQMRE
eukprot:101014-Pleurochrysis_carterae.AAC.7